MDIFCTSEKHKIFVDAFYCGVKNLNLILPRNELYQKIFQQYDLALHLKGAWPIYLDYVNVPRLKALAPKLLQAAAKISAYNKVNFYDLGSSLGARLRARMISRILNKNCFDMLSCDGALPIRDSKVDIPLLPEHKSAFDALKLSKYITVYSDIENDAARPKIKTWPIHYWHEYVARMKKRFPDVEIVQCGGGGVKRLRMPTATS